MERGSTRVLEFFNGLALATPVKFVDYLKVKYREKPSDNLHLKLSKKYCTSNEQTQILILDLIRNFSESFKNKENVDFFMGTFIASVFGCCKDSKGILLVVSDLQNIL